MSAQSSSPPPSAPPSTPPTTKRSIVAHSTPETVVRGVAMDGSSLRSSLPHLDGDPLYGECEKDSEAISRCRLLKDKISQPLYNYLLRGQILQEFDLLLQLVPKPVRVSMNTVVELALNIPVIGVRQVLLLEMYNLLYFQLHLEPDSPVTAANEARETDIMASALDRELEEDIDWLESWVLSGMKRGALKYLRAVGFSRNAHGVLLMVITVLDGTDYEHDIDKVSDQMKKLGLTVHDLNLEIRVLEHYGESIPCSETDVQSDESDEPKNSKDTHYEDAALTIAPGKEIKSAVGAGTVGLIVEITDSEMIKAANERFPHPVPDGKIFAIITAAHVVPRSAIFRNPFLGLDLLGIKATELSLNGALIKNHFVPDLTLLYIHANEDLNAQTLNTITSVYTCSYVDCPTHSCYEDAVNVEGKITAMWNSHITSKYGSILHLGQRVYMLGKHNKVFGSYVAMERDASDRFYCLICDIKAQRGDSGALLFILSDKDEFLGVGILIQFTPLPDKKYGIFGTKFMMFGELNSQVYKLPGVA